jgi:GT2 family glycosyltransferase
VYDLVLRLNEITKAIFHIPQVLQHRQTSSLEINKNGLSPDLLNLSFRRSLEDMLTRSTYSGWVETTPYPQVFRVRRHIVGCPLVSIIIPSAGKVISRPEGDQCLLETCIKSIRSLSTYSPYEIILVDGYDIPASVLAKVSGSNLRLVRCPEPFNFSQRINQGAAEAKGAFLVLLNDDIEVITPDWLESMLEFAQQQEIGAVGAKLLYPEGQIQHIGVTIQDSTPEHIYHGLDLHKTGYLYTAVTNRNCLAVTAACLMIRHEVFEQLDGMDEAFPLNYNDVDLCLKAYAAGYRNVVTPYAQLVHYESISRQKGLLPNEWKNFKYKWGTYLRAIKQDPYTSPNLASCIVSDDMA